MGWVDALITDKWQCDWRQQCPTAGAASTVNPVVRRKDDRWEGEDEDDDVKDNWDDDDEAQVPEENESSSRQSAAAASTKNKKKLLAKKIAEKEAKTQRGPLSPDEVLAEKLAKQRLQEESDLKLAMESFGTLQDVPLVSKEDMDEFRKILVEKMKSLEKSPLYVSFLESAFRDLCTSLEAEDIKRIASNLTTLSNEKLKASKASKKKKKPGAASLRMERSDVAYADDDYNEYDDFM